MLWGFFLVQQVAYPCWCSSCMPQTLTQTHDSAHHRCSITWSTLILMTSEVVVRLGSCACWSRCENIVTGCVRWSGLPLQLKMDARLLKVRQTTWQVSQCWKCSVLIFYWWIARNIDTVLTESIWLVNVSSCFNGMQKIGQCEVLGNLWMCEVNCLCGKSEIYAYTHF